jgi:hypothetical protein
MWIVPRTKKEKYGLISFNSGLHSNTSTHNAGLACRRTMVVHRGYWLDKGLVFGNRRLEFSRLVCVLLVAAGEMTTNKRCADSECDGHGKYCVRWCCVLQGDIDYEKQQEMDLIRAIQKQQKKQ